MNFIKKSKNDSKHYDAIERAQRLNGLFSQITEWEDDSFVPRYSLLREFIGNSEYSY